MIRTRDDALDYIAKKGSKFGYNQETRKRFAMTLLEGDFLPHISTDSDGNLKKAFFVGYMVNRLLTGALGRSTEDDRDYYGKKRLEMAGTLLASLYRTLFRQFVDEMIKQIKKDLHSNKEKFLINKAMRHETITRGLKSALSTGNWQRDK